ncbi:proteinase-activated receptor 1-like [Tachysurus ichikawai]
MSVSNTSSSVPPEEQLQISLRLLLVVSVHVVNYTLGLSLHAYIITMLLNRRRRLDPCDVSTLNQAAAEIFFMLFAPFHILLNVRSEMWFYKPLGSGMSVRSLLQCAVCLECYVAVMHPLTFRKFRALRYQVGMCVMMWVGGVPSGITCMFMFPDIPYQAFGVIYFMILSINLFSCVSILRKLRHSGPGQRDADRWGEDGAKKRAFHMVLMNLLVFVVQDTPIAVLFVTLHTLPSSDVCLAINLAMGWVQALFVLHKSGKFL